MTHVTPPARRSALTVMLAAWSLTALLIGALVLSSAARAALVDVPAADAPGSLVLASEPYPAHFVDLSPGQPVYWKVAAHVDGASEATLSLELRKSGELLEHPRGLGSTVDACAQAWSGDAVPVCAAGARRIAAVSPVDAPTSPLFDLDALAAGESAYLLVTLALEDSPEAAADASLRGLDGAIDVAFTAVAFDDVPVPPPASGILPPTGMDPSGVLGAAAVAAGLFGLAVVLRLRHRPEDPS